MADRHRIPVSRFLGLPWPEWGDTDRDLHLAYETHRETLCPQCGSPLDVCSDEDTEGRWQARVTTCHVTAARAAFYAEHKDTGPEVMLSFHLLPDGQTASDPLAFDPARAQAERAAMEARIAAI